FAEGDVLISIENIAGSGSDDIIKGNSEANQLHGNGGNDLIEGRDGNDEIRGDTNPFGFVYGDLDGDDQPDGSGGHELIFGNGGNDTLIGGSDNDQLFGDEGNDTLFGDQGFDHLDGGAGIDTVTYENSATLVQVFLNAGIGIGGDAAGDVLVNIEN